jgi:predicted GIY-YIG superfamily endonuclease
MSNFFVYILKCNDNSYYTGHTDNLEKRIAEHNAKSFDGYTAARLPIEVLYVEAFTTRDEAFNAERQIKGWSRKKKEALIKKNWDELIKLSNFGRSNGSTSSPRAE